jgi:hypothetical protein
MLENGIVLAQTGDVIDFDFSFAEVQTELTAEQEYTLAEWQDLNAYYKDLTNYNLFDRGFEGEYITVNTADKWAITLLRIFKKGESNTKLAPKPNVFFLDAMVSDCTYWTHHQSVYDWAKAGYDVWLGNTRFSKGFAYSTNKQGTVNEVAIHDVPAQIAYILKFKAASSLTVVTHGSGSSVMGYALGKYEESTLSFYNNFLYSSRVKKILAIAPCPITKASKNLNDNNLMFNCDKVPWYLYQGVKDDICTQNSVITFVKPALEKTGKLMVY